MSGVGHAQSHKHILSQVMRRCNAVCSPESLLPTGERVQQLQEEDTQAVDI